MLIMVFKDHKLWPTAPSLSSDYGYITSIASVEQITEVRNLENGKWGHAY